MHISTSNSGWKCLSFIKSWNWDVDHLKDCLCLQSYLSNIPLPNQPIYLLASLAPQIFPSYLAHNELDSNMQSIHKIVQIANWEPNISTSPFDHSSILGDYHSTYHFPNSTSNDSCFTLFDLHHL